MFKICYKKSEVEMDKEIIIDDVDVAGCRYHRMNNQMVMCTACNSGKGSPYCKYENNCYYKQLQRANQEIDLLEQLKDDDSVRVVNLIEENRKLETEKERLKEDLECAIQNVENLLEFKKQLKRLEQENAELKAENERLQKLTCFNCGEETLSPSGAEIYDKILVYKQTLQEIKAIAEKLRADNLCNNCDGIGLDANCQDTGCPYYQMDKILQKITKAEEE